jgi:nucleolin
LYQRRWIYLNYIVLCRIAYIDFKDQVSRSKAVALRGSDLDGCELYVDEAIPRDGSRGGQSGGRFGGRSGGRFGGRSGGRFGGRSGGRRGSSRFGGDNRFGGRGRGRGRQG